MAKIAIEREQHEFYRQLTGRSEDGGAGGIFPTMKDLFLICFGLGVRNGVPLPLNKRTEIFESTVFAPMEWASLEAIHVGVKKDINDLRSGVSDQRNNQLVIESAEQFANAGVVVLRREFDPRHPEIDLAYILLGQASA